jgi:hypothetical protein
VVGVNIKVVELQEYYNFVNWHKDWFGLVCELHGVEVGYIETEIPNFRLRNFLSVEHPSS